MHTYLYTHTHTFSQLQQHKIKTINLLPPHLISTSSFRKKCLSYIESYTNTSQSLEENRRLATKSYIEH